MKNLCLVIMAALMTTMASQAQVVTTTPAVLTADTRDITVTLHADWGSQGLADLPQSQTVYAHTGVITNKSTSSSDWRYASAWGDNSAKYRMTRTGTNTYTLSIPDIRTYYGITDPAEKVERLAFVFRSTDGREGKTVSGGDIFVFLMPSADFPESSAEAYGGTLVPGATANADGSVTFAIAAPGKDNALLVGSWNGYALDPAQQMSYTDAPDGTRYFWTTVSGLDKGKDYVYYYLFDRQTAVGDPYARLVVTPDDLYIPSSVYPDRPAYDAAHLPGVYAAVYNSDRDKYAWQVTDFRRGPQSELQIYELLLRDFTGTEGQALGNGTLASAMDRLEYLRDLGVNAIELMPIMEFTGNQSWGYNPNFLLAPDKAYGSPDEYRAFIDRAHQLGMAVILDIVLNQADVQAPWWQLYPIQDNPCFNGSAPHAYSVMKDWHQDVPLVQKYFKDALQYWLTEYKADGFRFDLVKGLGDNSSYSNPYDPATNMFGTPSDASTNRYNATRVARMRSLHDAVREVSADAYFINENLATAQEENEMAADGEINWANLNSQARQYAMGYADNSALSRFYAPDDSRTWGSTVSYAVSHDEERPAYSQARYGASGVKGNAAMSCRRLGSLAAQMLMTPGAHMIWQFEEFGASQSTKSSDGGNDTGNKKVVWSLLDNADNAGIHATYRDLLNFRRLNHELFTKDASTYINLSQTGSGRSLRLTAGDKGAYLFVNPKVSGSQAIASAVNLTDKNTYKLVSVSPGVTPTVNVSSVTLPAGAYALYATVSAAGTDDITADRAPYSVEVDGGAVTVSGEYGTAALHTLSGMSVPMTGLASGLYILTVDGQSRKIAIR